MAYYAEWAVFIDGDDLDPIEVARRAKEWSKDTRHGMWRVVNMETGVSTTVDIGDVTGPRIIKLLQPGEEQRTA